MSTTKHILLIVLMLILPIAVSAQGTPIHSYADHSVLTSGKWVKIKVAENGVYKLTHAEIRKAGLNPANLRIYGYGGAQLTQDFSQPKIDDLCSVPFYQGSDFVLFYAQGNVEWSYNMAQGRFAHTRNTYSDYGYYFLSDNAGEQTLLTPLSATVANGTTTVSEYIQLHLHEKDEVNLLDPSGSDGGGRDFYGERFANPSSNTFAFPTHDLSGGDVRLYARIANFATSSSTMTMTYSGQNTSATTRGTISIYIKGEAATMVMSAAPTGTGQQTVNLSFRSNVAGGLGYLDYIEMSAPANLTLTQPYQQIQSAVGIGKSGMLKYQMTNANASTMVWDVTKRNQIAAVGTSLEGSTLSWNETCDNKVHFYVAVNPNASGFLSAEIVGTIGNQDLHNLKDIDYVIICPEAFLPAARQLAQKHEQKDHYITAVVTDQQVYNEFSSGTPDATAYRWLMKMLYDRSRLGIGNAPQNLLLFGDGTFDNRKLLSKSGKNWLLTYEAVNSLDEVKAYATDDYFGFLGDNEGMSDTEGRMKIGVGRLPVNSTEEAQAVADKLCRYMDNPNPGPWKQNITFLADDGDNGTHTITAEAGAERVRLKNPSFIINKIYLDAYTQESSASGESYPVAYNRFHSLLNNGTFYMDYSGHGGYNTITNENMLSIADTRSMTNQNLGFWMLATCSFAHFDAGVQSSAEEAVLNPRGGAIGVMSACRTVYATQNTIINRNVCDTLLAHKGNPCGYGITLGKAISSAKNATGSDQNKMAYVLLGDPGLQLNYPTQYQILTDSIDGTSNGADTLRALSIHTVYGHIADAEGLPVSDFNGSLNIIIYDKMQNLTTLDNDETDPNKRVTLHYNDYPNKIFRGQAPVTDGQFSFTFLTPKDIRYNYGTGRIAYYALDSISYDESAEALGHYENFVIGGSNPLEIVDTVGPEMRIYLNSPFFMDGGQTHDAPHFYAELSDENGINSVGNGIGHDLLLTLDSKESYVLNNYYTNNEGSYKNGLVSYPMGKLTNGQHSLTFRAWDLLNNSRTASLNFEVVGGQDPMIMGLTAYPNPAYTSDQVHVRVHYDRPDEIVSSSLTISSIQGELVGMNNKTDIYDTNSIEHVFSPTAYGMKVGVYIYTVRIKTTSGQTYATQSGKLIVR